MSTDCASVDLPVVYADPAALLALGAHASGPIGLWVNRPGYFVILRVEGTTATLLPLYGGHRPGRVLIPVISKSASIGLSRFVLRSTYAALNQVWEAPLVAVVTAVADWPGVNRHSMTVSSSALPATPLRSEIGEGRASREVDAGSSGESSHAD